MLIARRLGLMIISILPLTIARHFFYRLFFGYKIIGKSKIGMFNYISCRDVVLQDAVIGSFNLIIVSKLTMAPGSFILKRNRIKHLNTLAIKESGLINIGNFIGAQKTNEGAFNFDAQNLFLGKRSEILRNNYFDVVRPITIGDNVVFGGQGSEIWTHGFEVDRTMLVGGVTFGDNIFIGSKCIFTKNINVTSNVTIGPGSVVYKSINESGFYSSHQIEKIR
jgi:acetyltransferase-like isoleucine patch superfamily enzyme